ncbi:gamma-glutamyltransferase family protein [Castellaniella sp.]|uniref:gamma-glutamyltransferase family protein n=1 Tax=Castellaniella sp. TaxID=1955812 RepID=UPI003C7723B3
MSGNQRKSGAMVSTGNPLAAQAARDVLEGGGSAVDAAIAADAVMGVVEPMATSIGGDLLAMIHQDGQPVLSYNGTGRAPLALDEAMVRALPGARIPERHPLSVTTPGAVRGWWDLHRRFGRLAWRDVFGPAIRHARQGFPVAKVAAHEWAIFDFVLREDPVCARMFRAGRPPAPGDAFRNPELADTLEHIAADGPDYFYRGPVAEDASRAVQRMGGVLAPEDFERHAGDFVTPLSLEFHGARIHECPPNTHGVAILDALAAVQDHGGAAEDPDTWVHMVRSTASAMAAAKRTVADPAGNTVCTVVVDGEGLAITLMSSVFKRFGSGIAVPGGGFCMQNRGFGFSEPGHINGPAPAKRPYHTVVPGMTTRDGEFLLGMGVVGGLMQPQGQIQILTRVLAWGWDIQDALNAPRWRLEAGDTLAIEKGFPDDLARALRASGYGEPHAAAGELAGRSDFGGAHAIFRAPAGNLQGAADPRKDGQWLSALRPR